MHTVSTLVVIIVLYGISFSTPTLRHISNGIDTVQKLLLVKAPEHDEVEAQDTSITPLRQKVDYYKPPMWSCDDTDRKKKLVFVHIFKTAGSSIRSLLNSYARQCNAGCVTVVNCGGASLDSIENGNWEKEERLKSRFHGTLCKLKKTVFRNNTVEVHAEAGIDVPINSTYLREAQTDIISGHVSIGTDHGWNDEKGQHVNVQYLTFFRESKRKFVSAVLYLRKDMTFEEAVDRVKEAAKGRLAMGQYLTNVNSIMTPAQRDDFSKRNITLSPEQEANLMIQNLQEKNILVGIVERMSESLEMLQHVVDKDGELDDLFEKFGKIPPGANATKEVIKNKSRLSSSEVLAEVEKDKEFMKTMRELIKWDEKVYKFALDLHTRQYEAFLKRKPAQLVSNPEKAKQVVPVKASTDQSLESSSDTKIAEAAKETRVKKPQRSSVIFDDETLVDISLPDSNEEVESMWSCRDKDRKKKLIFVHIFKTAGSSIRTLLSNYAEKCNAANAVVVNCAPVDPATIESKNWAKKERNRSRKHGSKCKLKKMVYRNNTEFVRASRLGGDVPINTTYLEESKVDILGGHITMGIDQYWMDEQGKHVDVQYLTFFRESTRKVVSAVLYMNPKASFEEAVEMTKARVRNAVKKSEYLDTSNYIVTPAKVTELNDTILSTAARANLMIGTLKEKKVLFGIVERMSESLEMLQHTIDRDQDLDDLFESFGMIPAGGNTTKGIIKNESKLSSSEVLAEVEKDEEFMKAFKEYVKYDEMIYKFALNMHMRQYESFLKHKPSPRSKPLKELDRAVIPIKDRSSVKFDAQVVEHVENIEVKPTESKVKPDDEASTKILSLNKDTKVEVEPMWSCGDTNRKKKLSFVHVFKTAGSSMRTLLSRYAEKCHAGNAVVVNCAPVDPASIESKNWVKKENWQRRSPCLLKKTVFRNSTVVSHTPSPINTTYLEEANIDILGGHITMGTDQYWKGDDGHYVDVQYLTFFRESTRKVVSAVLYINPKLTFDEAVEKTKAKVRKALANSEYLDTSRYIITPAHTAKLTNATLNPYATARLTMETLKENKVLFGIVERMSESLEMLQHVIDKDRELDDLFESFGMVPAGANKTEEVIKNQSKLSSSEVLAEVEKDEEFMKLMREYVKYDTMVYEFALDMHMRQYESFQEQRRSVTD